MFRLRLVSVSAHRVSKLGRVTCCWLHNMPIENVRNIGIVAHIDAGKTTTTERFLFASQHKTRMGEVDDGTTTTDYMDQERERGITIQSALTQVEWRGHEVRIIDTPGHVDFTMEVERSLRVLDGAVAIFDAVNGVEAQSRTVLMQAEKYELPFVTYINKMDRPQADFVKAIDSVERLIGLPVLPIQAPLFEQNRFVGFTDLLTLECFKWSDSGEITKTTLNEEHESVDNGRSSLKPDALRLRARLLDSLGGVSDKVFTEYIKALEDDDEAGLTVSMEMVNREIARASKSRLATVALCGSSGKNIAVPPVLDAAIDYLPSPRERPALVAHTPAGKVITTEFLEKDPLAVMVFKVIVQGQDVTTVARATLVRVYSGVLKAGTRIYNSTRDRMQSVRSISKVDGDNFSVEADVLGPGSVGCVHGLDSSFTGDTLCADRKGSFVLEGVTVPVPVVSASLEPYSEKEDRILEKALEIVKLEDPSISWSVNEYGQTVLSGMGALHVEVTKTKLERGWNLQLEQGPVKVKHREFISTPCEVEHTFLTKPEDPSSGACTMQLSLTPAELDENEMVDFGTEPFVTVTMSLSDMVEDEDTKNKLRSKWLNPIKFGVHQGTGAGPLVREPVSAVTIDVTSFKVLPRANEDTVGNAADFTTKLLLQEGRAGSCLLEPCFLLEVIIFKNQDDPDHHKETLDNVVSDLLSSRRGVILSQREGEKTIKLNSIVPVQEMDTYASDLLSVSNGEATFLASFHGYRIVRDSSVLDSVRGMK
ncbi:Elongation factor G 2 [Diplonema papillatum]|nr:Elongation factor G 2 [Diplonema papillatum]KAJ9445200.1 Elongation factor G 2 [Diplonema papillatum]